MENHPEVSSDVFSGLLDNEPEFIVVNFTNLHTKVNGNYPFLHYVAEKAQCAKSTQAIEHIRSAHTSMYSQWKVGMHPDLQQSISDFFVGFKKDFAAKKWRESCWERQTQV